MKRVLLVITILGLILTACSARASKLVINDFEQKVKSGYHLEKLNNFDSPYTLCFKNKDGTYTLYMFAAPIAYKDSNGNYQIIDNSLVKVADDNRKDNYSFENRSNRIKAYFPEKIDTKFLLDDKKYPINIAFSDSENFNKGIYVTFKNIYGDNVCGVKYSKKDNSLDIYSYATRSGIKTEISINKKPKSTEVKFVLDIEGATSFSESDRYITFKNGVDKLAMVYASFARSKDGGIFLDNHISSTLISDNKYLLKLKLDDNILQNNVKYPIKIDPSFEYYQNKMPDTGVYSNRNTSNAYLLDYSLVGVNDVFGESWQYIRYRFNYFFQTAKANIISSKYYIRELSGITGDFSINLNQLKEDWSSTKMIWGNRKEKYDLISLNKITSNKWNCFDITKFTKDCIVDMNWVTEVNGLILTPSNMTKGYRLFGSSDNSLYPPYIEITTTIAPEYFAAHENINPPIN